MRPRPLAGTRLALATALVAAIGGCHRSPTWSPPSDASPAAPTSPGEGGATSVLDASGDARVALDATAPTASATPFPFGTPQPIASYACPVVVHGGPFHSFLSAGDTRTAFVDGDDLLALANRSPTGALAPAYAPTDLVDVRDLSPRSAAECDAGRNCLRREAATALRGMLDAMAAAHFPGRVESAFRGFRTQCWVFDGWAAKARGGFCEAAMQSALPGHSQHQLGTTVDLFTIDWATTGPPFRDGFGCTPGGRWLDNHAWEHGFVLPYPIDPDDLREGSRCSTRDDHAVPINPRTGYKNEPWHLRFIGVAAARRYHEAWLASDPGSPGEITLEQWLRATRGLDGDAELPVCDGCQCGACATMAGDDDVAPCGDASLRLGPDGRAATPGESPHLDGVTIAPASGALVVEVSMHAPPHTPTQTPVTTAERPTYGPGSTFASLVPYDGTRPRAYGDLVGAWRVAVEPVPALATPWPWRASLAKSSLEPTWNRANLRLPASPGDAVVRVRVVVPPGTHALRVALLRDGVDHDAREVPLP